MAQQVMLKAKGLYTFQNFLSEIPEGSLLDATNVVIDRDGIVEPRRGIHEYGSFGLDEDDRAKQLLTYKTRVLVHYNNIIAYDDGTGTFTDFSGAFPEVSVGTRIKGVELNGNFYVTTSAGIKKIASNSTNLATATVTDAGGIKALDGDAVVDYSSPGFFLSLSKVAYRIVWGTYDVNENLILGSPSTRIVVTNFDTNPTGSATVDLTFNVPDDITTNYFYQVYRTAVYQADPFTLDILDQIDPGDEMQLVIQQDITPAEITAGVVTLSDITPEDFRQGGVYLYTNPTTGEGILQANEKPPVALDIAQFKNSIFYANTRTRHQSAISLLGVGGFVKGDITNISDTNPAVITSNGHGLSNGDRIVIVGTGSGTVDAEHVISNVTANTFEIPVDGTGASDTAGTWFSSYITISDTSQSTRYFFVGRPEVTEFTFDTQANTTDGGWFEVSSANDLVRYAIWFDKTGTTLAPSVTDAVLVRVPINTPIAADLVVQDLTYTADTAGSAGNNITIEYTSGATAGSEVVTVVGTAITVQIQAGVSTATQIKTKVDAHVTASGLVNVAITGSGAAPQALISATNLEGGTDGITAGTNVAESVKDAVEAATNDFVIDDSTPGVLTFVTSNNGSAVDAAAGTTPPGGVFAISIESQGFGEDLAKNYIRWSGYLSAAQAVDDTARSMVRVINSNGSEIVYGYYLSGPDDVPGNMQFERRDQTNETFSFQANNAAVGALFNPDLTTASESSNETKPNRLYFSKAQQPEAVPIVNYVDIGPKDKAILRIVPLRDSLFIFKEDGIYRLTGELAPNFSVILFDNSVTLVAPDTAAVLNNQIYCLTDGGIATVTETGVGIISRPIENVFSRIITNNYPNTGTASFGIGYETERCYMIWTVTAVDDTFATQMFRYNTFTRAWTRWDKPQTCITINQADNRIYVGATDENYVEVERKLLSRTDYADRDFELGIPNQPIISDTMMLISATADLQEGDALVQTQYLTIDTFNSLLKKLDIDPRVGFSPGVVDDDYYETLAIQKGDNLTNAMLALVAKLNADPGTSGGYTFSGALDFPTIQTEYNAMIAQINADPLFKFKNYQTSNGTTDFEMTIVDVDKNTNTIEADSIANIVVGPIQAFKGIRTIIVWAPSALGDPSVLKHVRESTILFEASNFRGAQVGYNSDLSPGYDIIDFNMDGNGTWSGFVWDENNWGGGGSSVPMRTYIPRQKQRCRYIRTRFIHNDAFYKFSILGNSYTFEVNSERAYRGK